MQVLTMAKPGSPEWLSARRGKIGGSDAAAILCGRLPDVRIPGKKTPLSVWERLKAEREGAQATDLAQDDEADDSSDEDWTESDELWWGTESEPTHIKALERDTGWEMQPSPGVIQHPDLPWLAGTPDAGVLRPDFPPGVCELKAPAYAWTRAEWDHGVPMAYQVQAAVYMLLWKREWSLVSAFCPPRRPMHGVVPLSPQVEEWILAGLTHFWENHVEADIPPEPAGAKDYDVARRLFSGPDSGEIVTLPPELIEASLRVEQLAREKTAIENELKALKARIVLGIGDAKWAPIGPGFVWRYAHQGTTIGRKDVIAMLEEQGHEDAAVLVSGMEKTARMLKKMKEVK